MSKKDYRVRNWREYNTALINRGSITFWIDEKAIGNWYSNRKGQQSKGRPNKYSDTAIITILLLQQVYKLTLRGSTGFIMSLLKLMKLDLEVPCYTQVHRRQEKIELPALPMKQESIHIVIDSSGLKVFGEGEWKVRSYSWSKHRTWRKLHIGVDEESKLIVAAILTGNDCGDDKQLPKLLKQYKGTIKQVSADGAYDSHECFDKIREYRSKATIPTQANPKHKKKRLEDIKRPRDEIVWGIQESGREEWKHESGYHRRSIVENTFYRYKVMLGDRLKSHKLVNQTTEALIRCYALNKMTLAGMPKSVVV